MSELADFLNDFNKIVGIVPKAEPITQESSVSNDELQVAKNEYSRILKLYRSQHADKIQRQLVKINKIYEFTKTYHEKKQPFIEKIKGLSKALHPVQAKQAQQELNKLREENSKNKDFLCHVVPNCAIETVTAELIRNDGINKIYDYEISLKTIEKIMSVLRNSRDNPAIPFKAHINSKSTVNDYIKATNVLKEYVENDLC